MRMAYVVGLIGDNGIIEGPCVPCIPEVLIYKCIVIFDTTHKAPNTRAFIYYMKALIYRYISVSIECIQFVYIVEYSLWRQRRSLYVIYSTYTPLACTYRWIIYIYEPIPYTFVLRRPQRALSGAGVIIYIYEPIPYTFVDREVVNILIYYSILYY